jgi:hypothetical protein
MYQMARTMDIKHTKSIYAKAFQNMGFFGLKNISSGNPENA